MYARMKCMPGCIRYFVDFFEFIRVIRGLSLYLGSFIALFV